MINFTLMKHQAASIERAKDCDHYAWLHDMGTGKTCTSLQILRYKCFLHKRLLRTVIFCPLSVTINWKREIEKFTKINDGQVHYLKGSGKKREEQLAKLIYNPLTQKNDAEQVIVLNYDAVQSQIILGLLMEWNPEFMICDEAHLLKNYKAIRAKHVCLLADRAKYRYLLTGTPILNSPMDLFFPYRIKDGGATFGKNFFVFRASYFYDKNAAWADKDNHFPKWTINPKREAELNSLLYQSADRVMKSECLDLPPLVRMIRHVELSDDQKKAYKDMKRDLIAYIDLNQGKPKAVVAQLAVTKALRLQQIVAGSVTADDGSLVTFDDTPRLKELETILEEISTNNKAIVWSIFKADYRAIEKVCKKLGIKYCFLTGEQTLKEKQASMDQFNDDPETKVIIANQAAGGTGTNLIAASYMIYFSKDFSLGKDQQSNDRNYRQGSQIHDQITRIDLVAPGTIDETVMDALAGKLEVAERILSKEFINNI